MITVTYTASPNVTQLEMLQAIVNELDKLVQLSSDDPKHGGEDDKSIDVNTWITAETALCRLRGEKLLTRKRTKMPTS